MKRRLILTLAALAALGMIAGLIGGSAVAQPVELTTSLTGGGQNQDPDGSGTAAVALDPTAGTVCFDLTWTKIRGPFAAHIHVGAAGESGDIVVHFFDMKGGTPLAGTIKGVSGCAKNVDDAVIDAILAEPAGYYVNVHNNRFPGGAVRGQVGGSAPAPTTSPTTTSSPYPVQVG